MKKFIIRLLSFIGIPIILLLALYLLTDPFKTLRPFSFQYFDDTNRDYLSSELFLRNDSIYHYNSFIFGSSRCCGFNTYHWRHYLPEGAKQFLFQAWSETLTGIEQKMDYLDSNGNDISNVLLVIDIPSTFDKEQLPKKVLSIKHYKFSGQSKVAFHACLFSGFVQKPSKWLSSIKQCMRSTQIAFPADTVTNDWGRNNRFADISSRPQKDSLTNCSSKVKSAFFMEINNKTDDDLCESLPLITSEFEKQLMHIKDVFVKHHTDYRIVISPAYCYTHPSINGKDLQFLRELFGDNRVFDYSGKNDITSDCYNFSDPNHFGMSVGWQIIEDIYNK